MYLIRHPWDPSVRQFKKVWTFCWVQLEGLVDGHSSCKTGKNTKGGFNRFGYALLLTKATREHFTHHMPATLIVGFVIRRHLMIWRSSHDKDLTVRHVFPTSSACTFKFVEWLLYMLSSAQSAIIFFFLSCHFGDGTRHLFQVEGQVGFVMHHLSLFVLSFLWTL